MLCGSRCPFIKSNIINLWSWPLSWAWQGPLRLNVELPWWSPASWLRSSTLWRDCEHHSHLINEQLTSCSCSWHQMIINYVHCLFFCYFWHFVCTVSFRFHSLAFVIWNWNIIALYCSGGFPLTNVLTFQTPRTRFTREVVMSLKVELRLV